MLRRDVHMVAAAEEEDYNDDKAKACTQNDAQSSVRMHMHTHMTLAHKDVSCH